MIKQLRRDWWLIVLLVTGCAALGVTQPVTFNEKLVVAVNTITGVQEEATKLVTLRVISPDDAQNIQDQAVLSRSALDLARLIHATDPVAGDARLNAALIGLNGLKSYLCLKPDAAGSPLCVKS